MTAQRIQCPAGLVVHGRHRAHLRRGGHGWRTASRCATVALSRWATSPATSDRTPKSSTWPGARCCPASTTPTCTRPGSARAGRTRCSAAPHEEKLRHDGGRAPHSDPACGRRLRVARHHELHRARPRSRRIRVLLGGSPGRVRGPAPRRTAAGARHRPAPVRLCSTAPVRCRTSRAASQRRCRTPTRSGSRSPGSRSSPTASRRCARPGRTTATPTAPTAACSSTARRDGRAAALAAMITLGARGGPGGRRARDGGAQHRSGADAPSRRRPPRARRPRHARAAAADGVDRRVGLTTQPAIATAMRPMVAAALGPTSPRRRGRCRTSSTPACGSP